MRNIRCPNCGSEIFITVRTDVDFRDERVVCYEYSECYDCDCCYEWAVVYDFREVKDIKKF